MSVIVNATQYVTKRLLVDGSQNVAKLANLSVSKFWQVLSQPAQDVVQFSYQNKFSPADFTGKTLRTFLNKLAETWQFVKAHISGQFDAAMKALQKETATTAPTAAHSASHLKPDNIVIESTLKPGKVPANFVKAKTTPLAKKKSAKNRPVTKPTEGKTPKEYNHYTAPGIQGQNLLDETIKLNNHDPMSPFYEWDGLMHVPSIDPEGNRIMLPLAHKAADFTSH